MKVALILVASLAVALGACPNIVSRADWGARDPTEVRLQDVPVHWVIVHHSESSECNDPDACAEKVRQIQDIHMDEQQLSDISYSFLVGSDGSIYEGRGWEHWGAHTPGWNHIGIGVCFIGSFFDHLPTPEALAAVQELIQCGLDENLLQTNYRVMGHQQAISTDCPGTSLMEHLEDWEHFEPDP